MALRNFSCIFDVSDDSLTDSAWTIIVEGDNLAVGNGYAIAAYSLLLLLIGIPWNVFVIVTVVRKRFFRVPIVMLMLNLAVTNLLACLFVLPFTVVSGFAQDFVFGSTDSTRCKVCALGLFVTITLYNSITTLSLMSADRFLYLKKPLEYNSLVTSKRMLLAIVIVWILSIVISIPPFFGFGSINFAHVIAACSPLFVGESHLLPNFYYAIFLTTFGLIPFIVLIVMYVWIAIIARKHILRRAKHIEQNSTDNLSSSSSSDNGDSNQTTYKNRQSQMIRLFLMLVSMNIILWIPLLFLAIAGAIVGPNRIPTLLYSIPFFSNQTGIVIHPILQTILIFELRQAFLKLYMMCASMLRKVFCMKKS